MRMHTKTWIAIALLTILASCSGGGKIDPTLTAPTILGFLLSFPADAAPASLPNAIVYVADSSSAITNAVVKVNGIALLYNSAPTRLEYEGTIPINPGDAITIAVTVNGKTYTADATQPTSYPGLTAPTSGAEWWNQSNNSVSWTGAAPFNNAYYLLGALDAADPAGGTPLFQTFSLSANDYSIPANSLTAGDKDLIIGIASVAPVTGASADSGIIVGGFNYVPITVKDGTTPVQKTLLDISVMPFNPSIVNGTTAQLNAIGTYSDNSTEDLTSQVTWSVLNQTMATIDGTGLFSAVGNGTTTVLASLGSLVGSTPVTVYQVLPLEVSSVTPATASTDVSVYSTVSATFNQAIIPNSILPDATSSGGFSLTQNGAAVDGKLTINNTNNTVTFTPSSSLLPNTQYVATLTTSIQNQADSTLPNDYTWTFTTEDSLFKDYVSIQTAAYPEAIAIGDVNGDGRKDVVITTSTSRNLGHDPINEYKVFVYLQDSTGNLSAPIKYATGGGYLCRVASVDIGDVNHDGRNDVVVGTTTCGIDVFLQAADGTLNSRIHYASADANKVRIADLNHDGLLDVVGAGSFGTNSVSVWLQNSAGTLTAPAQYSVMLSGNIDLEAGDINNDGLTDIIVMSNASTEPYLQVLTQNSTGTFNPHTDYNIGPNASCFGIGDINGDNLNDAVVTYANNDPPLGMGVFLQNGLATFDPASYLSSVNPSAVAISDVTNDERKDIIVLHNGASLMGIFEQNADGTLQAEHLYKRPSDTGFNPQALAIDDINGDGKPDVVSVDPTYGLVISYHY